MKAEKHKKWEVGLQTTTMKAHSCRMSLCSRMSLYMTVASDSDVPPHLSVQRIAAPILCQLDHLNTTVAGYTPS